MMNRGDVVLVDFPYSDGSSGKIRPSLVVQHDVLNHKTRETIVAMISGNISRVGEPHQLLIDPSTPDGRASGLHGASAVICSHLFTIEQGLVLRAIGRLSDATMKQIDDCLKAALGIP